jgi:polysaccharide biosynthesis protein PelA
VIAALLLLALPLAPAGAQWRESPRVILVPYIPEQIPGPDKDPYFLPAHQRAEVVLNYLGLDARYVDASKPLPEPGSRRDVRGVLAWFQSPEAFPDPKPVCRWLSEGLKAGWRVALVGQVGLHAKSGLGARLPDECSALLKALGVDYKGTRALDPLALSTVKGGRMLGFERAPDPSEKGIVPVVQAPGDVQARLTFSDKKTSEPVSITGRGAIALDPFFLYANQDVEPQQFRWVVDPFAFFEAAFAARGLPRPDPTTLSGRRVFMTRLDGDGFFNLSEVDRTKTSGEIFLREFIEKYSDLPFTVSLMAAYYDLALYNDRTSVTLSRRVLAHRNVEPASHGYAHPLVWKTGKVALTVPRYSYDASKEIVGSAEILAARLLPPGRKIELFQWTGDCLPTDADLAVANGAALLHINGGGGRMDRDYPGYAQLFPLMRPAGEPRQVYSGSYNENEYTELWSARYYGYRDVLETFGNTGAPRRIKPVDVYLHFYSGERYAAVGAVRKVYDWARAQPVIPVWGSRYVKAVRGFSEMKVFQSGSGRFRLKGGAALRTVRFDGENRVPVLSASKGVIGFKRERGSLYVSLDESDDRELVLGEGAGGGARLEEANFEPERWSASGGGVRFFKRGWLKSEVVLAGLTPGGSYRVSGAGLGGAYSADASGRLALRFPNSEAGGPAARVTVEAQ